MTSPAPDSRRVRIGVIGAGGRMGQLHARTYDSLPNAELVSVCDVDAGAATELGARLGVTVHRDFREMLADPGLEAVSVCTPDQLHVEPAVEAARAGKHVLLEKPIATTLQDAETIAEACAAAGVVLLVGHVLRFDPRFCAAAAALEAGELGALQTMFARRVNGVAAQDRLHGRVNLQMFLGVHDYDLLRWYARAEVVEVVARSRWGLLRRNGHDVEDATTAIFTFENGVMATSELGWILPRSFGPSGDHRIDLIGDAGCFKIDSMHSGVTKSSASGNVWVDPFTAQTVSGAQAGSFANELAHFLRVIRGREAPALTPGDAIAAVALALAVTEAAATGQAVRPRT
jgi:predicted dehydrogenase